jgi:hypothetical protein
VSLSGCGVASASANQSRSLAWLFRCEHSFGGWIVMTISGLKQFPIHLYTVVQRLTSSRAHGMVRPQRHTTILLSF